jgi:hypothetical protein
VCRRLTGTAETIAIVLSSRLGQLRVENPGLQAMLHEDAHEEGGLGFTNRELLASQRGCVGVALDSGRHMRCTCSLPVCHSITL